MKRGKRGSILGQLNFESQQTMIAFQKNKMEKRKQSQQIMTMIEQINPETARLRKMEKDAT